MCFRLNLLAKYSLGRLSYMGPCLYCRRDVSSCSESCNGGTPFKAAHGIPAPPYNGRIDSCQEHSYQRQHCVHLSSVSHQDCIGKGSEEYRPCVWSVGQAMAERDIYVRCGFLFPCTSLCLNFFFEEVLDEYLATLNVHWSNDTGLALDVYVSKPSHFQYCDVLTRST